MNGFHVLEVGSWGFPLIRLYQRFIFRQYIRHRLRMQEVSHPVIKKVESLLDGIIRFASWVFAIDNLFLRGQHGVGFILITRKEDA